MKRLSCLLAAGAIAAPLPAFADCATGIAAVENHPAFMEAGATSREEDSDTTQSGKSASTGSQEQVVEEEVVGEGKAVEESGGETVYQEDGPATPRENWFGSPPDRAAVLAHLETAKEARKSGDEKACLESLEKAEKVMEPDSG